MSDINTFYFVHYGRLDGNPPKPPFVVKFSMLYKAVEFAQGRLKAGYTILEFSESSAETYCTFMAKVARDPSDTRSKDKSEDQTQA